MTTKSERPPDWDPLPADREWFRSGTGERGYRVRRDGQDAVRLDRPMQEIIVPIASCVRDEYGSQFHPDQIARVAFMADRGMCAVTGDHAESRRVWQELPDKVRIEFARKGPPASAHPARRELFNAIYAALRPYMLGGG